MPDDENKVDKIIRFCTYMDQSPLLWGCLGLTLVAASYVIEEGNKLGADIILLLAGAVMTRIRSKRPNGT